MSYELALDMSRMMDAELYDELNESWEKFHEQATQPSPTQQVISYPDYLQKLDIDPESQPPKMLWQKMIQG